MTQWRREHSSLGLSPCHSGGYARARCKVRWLLSGPAAQSCADARSLRRASVVFGQFYAAAASGIRPAHPWRWLRRLGHPLVRLPSRARNVSLVVPAERQRPGSGHRCALPGAWYWPALAALYLGFSIAIIPPIARMIWSLRDLPLRAQRQLLRESSALPLFWRSFFLWEMRHAPAEERIALLRHLAASRSEPAAESTDTETESARD